MKNILITGSGGFIGKNLKEYLKTKYNLLTPRSSELNLCNRKEVETYFSNHTIDFIIHCASTGGARGVQDKNTTIEENLSMVENLLKNKQKNVRMILFGSGAMYDKTRPICKISEAEIGRIIPEDLYGKSKMLIANMIKDRKDILMLNIFACYGYGEKASRFPTYAINQAIKNLPIEINQNVVFDYLFVEDMDKIVEYFIKNIPQNNILNITPTYSISLKEIAETINSITKIPVDIIIKNPAMNNEYTGDNSLLLKNYPELTFTDMKTGITKLYQYIKSNLKIELEV